MKPYYRLVSLILVGITSASSTAAQSPSRDLGTLSGRVVAGATSQPLVSASVTLIPLEAAGRANGSQNGDHPELNTRSSFTSADGAYGFAAIAPAKYSLLVVRDGYRTRTIEVEVGAGADLRLSVALEAVPAPPSLSPQDTAVVVAGRVTDVKNGEPVASVEVTIEGTRIRAVTDSDGRYRLVDVPPGPQTIRTRRIGYAVNRIALMVPEQGELSRDIQIAVSALMLDGVVVTADPLGRARDELGTASVIDKEAISNQNAVSLAGVLELVPGVPVQPPGLEAVQQIALRSVPTSGIGSASMNASPGGPTTADLASFGTLIVIDGVPASNNANLQGLGARADFTLGTSAGGGIDLRRIPATMLERVEVIRGIPSPRYGDLTQGAVIVDTRAGIVQPVATLRYDGRTIEASLVGGREFFDGSQTGTLSFDFANTRVSPGLTDDNAYRIGAQGAHRVGFGRHPGSPDGKLIIDTRLDYFQMYDDRPEQPEVRPGRSSQNRDNGLRISSRARLALGQASRIELTAAVTHQRQKSWSQRFMTRGAMPFTDRVTEGRSIGHYVGGQYLARVDVDGDPWLVFGRLEGRSRPRFLGVENAVTGGVELRREWNSGLGYQFDMEFPPQVSFNGVEGFDRPRPYDDIPALVASALYVDDRVQTSLGGATQLILQAGLRLDLLHQGGGMFSGIRDHAIEPRVNLEFAPIPWIRLRAAAGRLAKLPSLAQLYPGPQYYDVINVNWYANDPAERLAVLTTSIEDPTNQDLGFSTSNEAELGAEFVIGRTGGVISAVAFARKLTGGVGYQSEPTYFLRHHYALSDSSQGTGVPPDIVEPPAHSDTVPVLIYRPDNNLQVNTRGIEVTAFFPEIKLIKTRFDLQGAWIREELLQGGLEYGTRSAFSDFQLNGSTPRTPYWEGRNPTGERAILTYRLVHQRPRLGLIITAYLQHYIKDVRQDLAGTDTLAFAGYLTRDGQLVPVPAEDRTDPQYADLRKPRAGILSDPASAPPDWLFSIQVSKTLPLDGRLSFYAFNAFDRQGGFGTATSASRIFSPVRFGFELTMPLGPRRQ